MSSEFGRTLRVGVFGQSHGAAIGVTVDGLPAGERIDLAELQAFLDRRKPGKSPLSTARKENDVPQFLSGLRDGATCGSPLCAVIYNSDQHSSDYTELADKPRPSHADYTAWVKWGGQADMRGGGHFSGRLTAPLVFAGAVCGQILERRGIYTGAHIAEIHGIQDDKFDRTNVTKEDILDVRYKKFPVINDEQGQKMFDDIQAARMGCESLGGIIECACVNVPAGIGSPIFDGLENTLAQLIFGIPAVKGLEFGAGFLTAKMVGSQNNDEFYIDERGHVKTKSNNHGGILGGISSGMPITLNVAIKPTPSIAKPQETIDYSNMKNDVLSIKGRHDPCIVPRAVPCVEAAVNIGILSHMLDYPNF